MKIVCESCSAKYSIADEKVAGRVFKIRCKKCGAAIVVRGDQSDEAGGGGGGGSDEQPTRVVDYGGEAVWHIVVEGEQMGPYAPAQLGEMLSAGTLTWDAYVWREGYEDWKPAQDIEELVAAIMGGSGGAEAAPEPAAAGGDPFAASGAAASHGRGSDGADLFAQTADTASPFGGGRDDDDVVASAPAPRVSAEQSLTGARNENSVLFSLSNLQALATGGSGGGGAPAPGPSPSAPMMAASAPSGGGGGGGRAGHATGEGSGLIDIRALAGATGVASGGGGGFGGGGVPKKADRVDDLLSIGGAGSGGLGLGSALGAPVLIPEKKEESSKGLMYAVVGGATVAVLAAAAVIIVVVTSGDDPQTPVASVGPVATGETVNTNPTGANPTGTGTPTGGNEAPPTGEAPTAAETGETPTPAGGTGGTGRRNPTGRTPTKAGGEGGTPAEPTERPGRDSMPSSREATGGGDIDDLLNDAIGGGGGGGRTPARPAAPPAGGGGGGGSGPPTPSRGDIVSAMNSVSGAVSSCGAGQHGIANVRIVFSGSTGRVTNATVAGGSFPPPVASCIARAARGARVPTFQQPTFSVNYPFRL